MQQISWVLSTIMTKIITRRTGFDLISLMAWQMLLGALPLILIAMIVPDRPVQWTPYFTFGLFFSSVISQGLALLLWFFILSELPAGVAGIGTLAIPVIGMIAAQSSLASGHRSPKPGG